MDAYQSDALRSAAGSSAEVCYYLRAGQAAYAADSARAEELSAR